ncbi:hypothetical protein B0H21DRAFT_706127 [Amylocystis lapponica]|nr:hypothetical protein B0H21DRAFT_706127 [Amylocystis lapponica]
MALANAVGTALGCASAVLISCAEPDKSTLSAIRPPGILAAAYAQLSSSRMPVTQQLQFHQVSCGGRSHSQFQQQRCTTAGYDQDRGMAAGQVRDEHWKQPLPTVVISWRAQHLLPQACGPPDPRLHRLGVHYNVPVPVQDTGPAPRRAHPDELPRMGAGSTSANEEHVHRAAHLDGTEVFIERLPNGFATYLDLPCMCDYAGIPEGTQTLFKHNVD